MGCYYSCCSYFCCCCCCCRSSISIAPSSSCNIVSVGVIAFCVSHIADMIFVNNLIKIPSPLAIWVINLAYSRLILCQKGDATDLNRHLNRFYCNFCSIYFFLFGLICCLLKFQLLYQWNQYYHHLYHFNCCVIQTVDNSYSFRQQYQQQPHQSVCIFSTV